MRGSRIIGIIALVATLGGITLALVLKHQHETLKARHQQILGPVPATR